MTFVYFLYLSYVYSVVGRTIILCLLLLTRGGRTRSNFHETGSSKEFNLLTHKKCNRLTV